MDVFFLQLMTRVQARLDWILICNTAVALIKATVMQLKRFDGSTQLCKEENKTERVKNALYLKTGLSQM